MARVRMRREMAGVLRAAAAGNADGAPGLDRAVARREAAPGGHAPCMLAHGSPASTCCSSHYSPCLSICPYSIQRRCRRRSTCSAWSCLRSWTCGTPTSSSPRFSGCPTSTGAASSPAGGSSTQWLLGLSISVTRELYLQQKLYGRHMHVKSTGMLEHRFVPEWSMEVCVKGRLVREGDQSV